MSGGVRSPDPLRLGATPADLKPNAGVGSFGSCPSCAHRSVAYMTPQDHP